jgi:hypothetical protein
VRLQVHSYQGLRLPTWAFKSPMAYVQGAAVPASVQLTPWRYGRDCELWYMPCEEANDYNYVARAVGLADQRDCCQLLCCRYCSVAFCCWGCGTCYPHGQSVKVLHDRVAAMWGHPIDFELFCSCVTAPWELARLGRECRAGPPRQAMPGGGGGGYPMQQFPGQAPPGYPPPQGPQYAAYAPQQYAQQQQQQQQYPQYAQYPQGHAPPPGYDPRQAQQFYPQQQQQQQRMFPSAPPNVYAEGPMKAAPQPQDDPPPPYDA